MTAKEGAVLWLMKVLESGAPSASPENTENAREACREKFPQFRGTQSQMDKIQAAYDIEVARIKKRMSQYMTGRGLK